MDRLTLMYVSALAVTALSLHSCGLKKEHITESQPIKVEAMAVTSGNIESGRSYTGTVTSGDGAQVSFTIPGTVKAIYVSEGDRVSKGQLLAEIKSENLVNAYNISKAALNEAQDAYNRFKQLHDANALADIKWVEVQNALTAAQNVEQVAARALDDARIHAPVSGTIARKMVDVGQTVIPAVPVMEIISMGDLEISIPVPETDINSLTEGMPADITVGALNDMHLSGTLKDKGIVANPLTRAYDVRFKIDNTSGKLLPGMICTVNLAADTTAAIVLPTRSVLLSADNRNFVWLASGGHAAQRFVEAPDITAQGIVISSGLQHGDTVIVAGMQKVSEGTPVVVELKK